MSRRQTGRPTVLQHHRQDQWWRHCFWSDADVRNHHRQDQWLQVRFRGAHLRLRIPQQGDLVSEQHMAAALGPYMGGGLPPENTPQAPGPEAPPRTGSILSDELAWRWPWPGPRRTAGGKQRRPGEPGEETGPVDPVAMNQMLSCLVT